MVTEVPTDTRGEPALEPTDADEGMHPSTGEPHWSESWYFDAISDDGSIGLYVRVGRVPERGASLYTAAIVRPGREPVLIVDRAAPLPTDENQTIRTADLLSFQECVEPLRRFRVFLEGAGRRYEDDHGPLSDGTSETVDVRLDLVWDTDGRPYQWRFTPRYEIPCRVVGTVRIGSEEFTFTGPGQRDHSWGPRDWWGHEWMWCALHLDDGTRIHAVAITELPGMIIGYSQRDGDLVELGTGSSSHEADDHGLVGTTVLVLDDVGTRLEVEPVAFGALRMDADDGRVSFFPRAMARVRTDDGRDGVGWIEWNHVQG